MDYEQSMKFICKYTKSGARIKDLSRIQRLMDKLGNPQNALKFVHIAGTNGKGSVLELTSQALINAGYTVGQFTSPYIKCYEDRIRINSFNISKVDLCRFCEITARAAENDEYSQFEITMAIAMLYFKEKECDIVFLEAGIGGLLDSTNIIENPLVCVITSISLDHTAILGSTVEQIAMQKAGIIKRGCPAVLSWNNTKTELIFRKECILKDAQLISPDREEFSNCKSDADGCSFTYKGNDYKIRMHGSHQIINAADAVKVIEVLRTKGFEISDDDVKKAFSEVQIPARTEIIEGDIKTVIDGGHNPAGVSALLSTLMTAGIEKPVMIFGMVSTKDSDTAAMLISSAAGAVICVDSFAPDSIDRQVLADKLTCEKYTSDLTDAYALAKQLARRRNTCIVVSGSLYLTEKMRKIIIK